MFKNNFSKTKINILVIMSLLILFLMAPFFVFTSVLSTNPNLKRYLEFVSKIDPIWLNIFTTSNLPGYDAIILSHYLGYVFLFLFFVTIVVYFFVARERIYVQSFSFTPIVVAVAILMILTSCLLFAYSEYQYGFVEKWCESISGPYKDSIDFISNINDMLSPIPSPMKDILRKELIDLAVGSKTPNNRYPFIWVGMNYVWWTSGIQILMILFILLKAAFKIDSQVYRSANDDNLEQIKIIRSTFGTSFTRKIIAKFLVPNEFNISLGVVVFSILIFAPQIFYSFYAALPGSNLHRFLLLTYLYPSLTRNIVVPGSSDIYDTYNKMYYDTMLKNPHGNLFVASNLPVIGVLILLAFLLGFIYIIIKKPQISRFHFISLHVGYFVILLMGLSFCLYSQSNLIKIVNYWNGQNDVFKTQITEKLLGLNYIKPFWVTKNGLIGSAILSVLSILALITLSINHTLKIKIEDWSKRNKILNAQ